MESAIPPLTNADLASAAARAGKSALPHGWKLVVVCLPPDGGPPAVGGNAAVADALRGVVTAAAQLRSALGQKSPLEPSVN